MKSHIERPLESKKTMLLSQLYLLKTMVSHLTEIFSVLFFARSLPKIGYVENMQTLTKEDAKDMAHNSAILWFIDFAKQIRPISDLRFKVKRAVDHAKILNSPETVAAQEVTKIEKTFLSLKEEYREAEMRINALSKLGEYLLDHTSDEEVYELVEKIAKEFDEKHHGPMKSTIMIIGQFGYWMDYSLPPKWFDGREAQLPHDVIEAVKQGDAKSVMDHYIAEDRQALKHLSEALDVNMIDRVLGRVMRSALPTKAKVLRQLLNLQVEHIRRCMTSAFIILDAGISAARLPGEGKLHDIDVMVLGLVANYANAVAQADTNKQRIAFVESAREAEGEQKQSIQAKIRNLSESHKKDLDGYQGVFQDLLASLQLHPKSQACKKLSKEFQKQSSSLLGLSSSEYKEMTGLIREAFIDFLKNGRSLPWGPYDFIKSYHPSFASFDCQKSALTAYRIRDGWKHSFVCGAIEATWYGEDQNPSRAYGGAGEVELMNSGAFSVQTFVKKYFCNPEILHVQASHSERNFNVLCPTRWHLISGEGAKEQVPLKPHERDELNQVRGLLGVAVRGLVLFAECRVEAKHQAEMRRVEEEIRGAKKRCYALEKLLEYESKAQEVAREASEKMQHASENMQHARDFLANAALRAKALIAEVQDAQEVLGDEVIPISLPKIFQVAYSAEPSVTVRQPGPVLHLPEFLSTSNSDPNKSMDTSSAGEKLTM